MTVGHVTLDGVQYMLIDPRSHTRGGANQMAAKLGTGAGNYDDLENWAAWLMDDWSAGAGQKRGDDPGFEFSTADTRFGGQIILPPLAYNLCQPWDTATNYWPSSYIAPDFVNLTAASLPYVRFKVLPAVDGATMYAEHCFIRARVPNDNTVIRISLGYRDNGTGIFTWPTTLTDITYTEKNNTSHFLGFPGAQLAIPAGSTGYMRIQVVSGGLAVHGFSAASTGDIDSSVNGSTWVDVGTGYVWVCRNTSLFTAASNTGMMLSWAGTVYYATHDRKLFSWTSSGGWVSLSAAFGVASSMPCAMVVVGGVIWVAYTGSTTLYQWSIAGGSGSNSVLATTALWVRDYIWRANGNSLYYSSDGTTWSDAIAVGAGSSLIRDICNLGGDTYVATDDGLYLIAPGDQAVPATEWPTRTLGTTNTATNVYPSNPIRMTNWQGSLYVAMRNTLYRYDQGGSLINLSLTLNGAFPSDWQGKIVSLGSSPFFLYAAVSTDASSATITAPDVDTGYSSVWAYNGQGWHCAMRLPRGVKPTTCPIEVEPVGNRLLVMTNDGIMATELPDSLANPYEDARSIPFAMSSNVYFEWFDGGLREAKKDFESVYISGENITSTCYVRIYWMDDASTDWEELGDFTANNQEVRWSDSATRPNTKRIKIRLQHFNNSTDPYATPRVDAIRVKYAPMVADRWRWQIPIEVCDNQEMLDGVMNPVSAATMRTNLNALVMRVPPFSFTDLYGDTYDVKVTNSQWSVVEMLYQGSAKVVKSVLSLTLEQVVSNL